MGIIRSANGPRRMGVLRWPCLRVVEGESGTERMAGAPVGARQLAPDFLLGMSGVTLGLVVVKGDTGDSEVFCSAWLG